MIKTHPRLLSYSRRLTSRLDSFLIAASGLYGAEVYRRKKDAESADLSSWIGLASGTRGGEVVEGVGGGGVTLMCGVRVKGGYWSGGEFRAVEREGAAMLERSGEAWACESAGGGTCITIRAESEAHSLLVSLVRPRVGGSVSSLLSCLAEQGCPGPIGEPVVGGVRLVVPR